MAAEAARSGSISTERKLFLTLTGLLMEGGYTNYRISSLLGATRAAVTNLRMKPIPTDLWQTALAIGNISMRSLRVCSAQDALVACYSPM
jgi:hypothetical protein